MKAKITTEVQVFVHVTLTEKEAAALARLASFSFTEVLRSLGNLSADFDGTAGRHLEGLKSLLSSAKDLEPKLEKIKRNLAMEGEL